MSKLEVIFEDKSVIGISVCPFRVTSQSTVVDDSEEFHSPQDPIGKLAPADDDPAPRDVSAIEWYRSRSSAYGVTSFKIIENLLQSVQQNPSGRLELDFNRCGYTNLHVQIALDALLSSRPQCLTSLHLCRNRLINPSLVRFLGNFLQELQTIAHLSLSYNTLDDECVGIFSEALSNSGVRRIVADHCQISDKGGSMFFTAMAYSDCIETIDLSWNQLGRASGLSIGKFLSQQRSLEKLILSGNHLHPEVESIVPLLLGAIGNQVLANLDLSWNGLRGEAFGRALLKYVPQTKLKCLNLEHNLLATEEMPFIITMLKKSEHLLELRLGGNVLDEEMSYDLAMVAERHPSLVLLSFGRFQFVSQRTANLCTIASRKKPSKLFIYQGVLMANPPRPVDVHGMLLERARFLALKPKTAKLKRNLGHLMLQFCSIQDKILTRDEFLLAVKQFRAKLDRALIDALMDAFAVPKQCVDAGAMANKYLTQHPTEPPMATTTKRKPRNKK